MRKGMISFALFAVLCGGFAPVSLASDSICILQNDMADSDWDKVLDEFDKYVSQYEKTYKKAMAGDEAAMIEYVKLAAKAQSLSRKLEKAKGEMTSAQVQKYLKILTKMTKILEMS